MEQTIWNDYNTNDITSLPGACCYLLTPYIYLILIKLHDMQITISFTLNDFICKTRYCYNSLGFRGGLLRHWLRFVLRSTTVLSWELWNAAHVAHVAKEYFPGDCGVWCYLYDESGFLASFKVYEWNCFLFCVIQHLAETTWELCVPYYIVNIHIELNIVTECVSELSLKYD